MSLVTDFLMLEVVEMSLTFRLARRRPPRNVTGKHTKNQVILVMSAGVTLNFGISPTFFSVFFLGFIDAI